LEKLGVFLPPAAMFDPGWRFAATLLFLFHPLNPSRYLSASSAAMHPVPALVTACR
jgi:hypothetical protein